MKYIPVIGLEIHAEMLTKTKVFCNCANEFGGKRNDRVCPVCSGMPGTLPVLNREAVTLAVRAGIALGCEINEYSAFDRKNYFYPDLPKAYQITQFEHPICENGQILVRGKNMRINRIHIEEDAGKLTHDEAVGISMADYNRCGVPLIEIVTEPDLGTVEEVQAFVEQVALRLKYAGVCDARLEQGSLRVDVNISIMPENSEQLGTRTEIKNLNSVKAISKAIEYEILRQERVLEEGRKVIQETRRFDEKEGKTIPLRSKEESHDYRYFPEPDIVPVRISGEQIEEIRKSMPEGPEKRFERYTGTYHLPEEDARLIIGDKAFSDFYDETVKLFDGYKAVSNMMLGEFNRNINETGKTAEEVIFTPQDLAELVRMSEEGVVSKNAAKEIFKIMFETGEGPGKIAEDNGFIMENDVGRIEEIVDMVLAENKNVTESYKKGNQKMFGFLMGQVIRCVGNGANPKLVREILARKLDE